MMPWLIVGVFNSYFFSGSIINDDNEHLAQDSARELREVHQGVWCLIGDFGEVNILVLSLHSPKV